MSKHTPGPRQAVTFSDEHSPCIIDAEGDGRIAELTGNQTDEQTEANAALIAAAPELLEALKLIDGWWREGDAPLHAGALLTSSDETIQSIVRAAIEKAGA